MNTLGTKGRLLLAVLAAEIHKGRVKSGDPTTFVPYSEALAAMGHVKPYFFAGRRLQYAGLNELNEWTMVTPGIPQIAGLIVNKTTWEPSDGYPKSHGLSTSSTGWKVWWMAETDKAIAFDWSPYI